jgi:hypothetical protein
MIPFSMRMSLKASSTGNPFWILLSVILCAAVGQVGA